MSDNSQARPIIAFLLTPLISIASMIGTASLSADAIESWEFTNPQPTNQPLYSVVANDNKVVALGAQGTILTSEETGIWVSQESVTNAVLYDAVWNGSKFIAVGAMGTILTSQDGETWSVVDESFDSHFYSIIWTGHEFIAVGSNGAIVTSTDGELWAQSVSGVSTTLRDIAYFQGILVAVGDSATMLRSEDAVEWEQIPADPLYWAPFEFVTSGPDGFFTTTENFDTLATSTDGRSWSYQWSDTPVPGEIKDVSWLSTGIYAIGVAGTDFSDPTDLVKNLAFVVSSADAQDWFLWKSDKSSQDGLNAIAEFGEDLIAVGVKGSIMVGDIFGNWNHESVNFTDNRLQSVTWNGDRFVSVGTLDVILQGWDTRSPGSIFTSEDGLNWTEAHYSVDAGALYSVNDVNGQLIAVGSKMGTNSRDGIIMTSPDGLSWGSQTIIGSTTLYDVATDGETVLIAGRENALYRPQETTEWKLAPYPTGFRATAVVWNGAEFLAVGDGIASSVDGKNWSVISSLPNRRDITCNDQVCVSVGTYPGVAISEDGFIWEEQLTGKEQCEVYDWGEECYGPNLKSVVWNGYEFVASGSDVVISSVDGIHWEDELSPKGAWINELIWADGQYLAVGDNGLVLSGAESPFSVRPFIDSLKPRSAILNWSTKEKSTGVVKFGTSPESLDRSAKSKKSKLDHSVRLNKLEKATTYYYQVTVTMNGEVTTTPVNSFTTQ